MKATWYKGRNNWGDILNKELIEKISGEKVEWIKPDDKSNIHRYYCIGSILQWVQVDNASVWGTGFIAQDRRLKFKPKIHAVRGPLTRKILLEQGFDCPEVYGDPALLYPRFYNPDIKKKYKLGIIPHYIDQDRKWITKMSENQDILIIDITSGINNVVNQIKSCENIASSSLHGIIAGDSYGIPSVWIKLSDKVLGNGFKFKDYFLSVNRKDIKPLIVKANSSIEEVYEKLKNWNKIEIDLDKLMDVCPFKK